MGISLKIREISVFYAWNVVNRYIFVNKLYK